MAHVQPSPCKVAPSQGVKYLIVVVYASDLAHRTALVEWCRAGIPSSLWLTIVHIDLSDQYQVDSFDQ